MALTYVGNAKSMGYVVVRHPIVVVRYGSHELVRCLANEATPFLKLLRNEGVGGQCVQSAREAVQ